MGGLHLSKKIFIGEGLTGIMFIVCGVLLQFFKNSSDVISFIFLIISMILIVTIIVIKALTRKKKFESADELSKLNMVKAESVLYKMILGLGLGITFLIQICSKDSFRLTLNWYTFMIFYGCCNLAYWFLFKYFNESREVMSD